MMGNFTIIDKAWESIEQIITDYKQQGIILKTHDGKKQEFAQKFSKLYNYILKTFMSEETKDLDPHKQAAILIISAIECEIVDPQEDIPNGNRIIYNVALAAGIVYLQNRMSARLKNADMPCGDMAIEFPEAFTCETPYFSIMTRMLYYEDPKQKTKNYTGNFLEYNILELSDRLFLLEYITLLQNGIDLYKLAQHERSSEKGTLIQGFDSMPNIQG